MHKSVRELVAKAETIGWSCDGVLDGHGHYTLVHENGARFPIAATPSDVRSDKNAIASLERIAGRKTKRIVRNRSHKKVERTDFDPAKASRANARWADRWGGDIEALHVKRDEQIAKMRELADNPTRCSAVEAKKALAEISALEDQLTRFGQPFHPFDLTDLGEPS